MSAAATRAPETFDEARWARELIARVVAECPERTAGTLDEARAHAIVRDELEALGLRTEVRAFEWNRSAYANLALHFGLGTLGSLVAGRAPWLGLLLHAVSAASYAADSARKGFFLRNFFPTHGSQNVLGVMPAKRAPRLRVVFLAHVDAAFTGVAFRPELAKRLVSRPGSALYKGLRVATGALAGLAALDVAQLAFGRSRLRALARLALSVPPLLAFAFNLDVVLRDRVVPGAMDDLSGVAGMLLLARRLRDRVPDDVEVVFVATGSEEAGLGGAQALARDAEGAWSRDRTIVLGLDGLANGELRSFLEGEVFRVPLVPWLRDTVEAVRAHDPRFAEVGPFEIPVGGTDAIPFAVRGWPAVTFGCVDRSLGMPRHYHLPTDSPENLEAEKIPWCVDFVERVFHAIVTRA